MSEAPLTGVRAGGRARRGGHSSFRGSWKGARSRRYALISGLGGTKRPRARIGHYERMPSLHGRRSQQELVSEFWVRARTAAVELGLDSLDRPGMGDHDGAFALRRPPVTSLLLVWWQDRPDGWRVRLDLGYRHDWVESLLDGYYEQHPYMPLGLERLTFSQSAKPLASSENPLSVHTALDAKRLLDFFRRTAVGLDQRAESIASIPTLLEAVSEAGANTEVKVACRYLMGDLSGARETISAVTQRSSAATTAQRMAWLLTWLEGLSSSH